MTFHRIRCPFLIAAVFLLCTTPPFVSAQTVLVMPYLQPGDGRTLVGMDTKVIRWLTDQEPGDFSVEYQIGGGCLRSAMATRIALDFPAMKIIKTSPPKVKVDEDDDPKEKKDLKESQEPKDPNEAKKPKEIIPPVPEVDQHYYRYTAVLTDLPFNSEVHYRVKLEDRVIRSATFKTRPTAEKSVRCVLVGDLAQGRKAQNPIAYQISKEKPEFLVALGDIVYPTGRVNQYMAYFWNTYNNVVDADPKNGAPLMATTTIYPVIGNHDVAAKLLKVPDALGAYYFFSGPRGGPGEGPWITPLEGEASAQVNFRAATKDSYPYIDAYSFNYGPAHFVVLNVNPAMKIETPEFTHWLRNDLLATKAKWKLVCFHMPGFQSAKQHYPEQQIRPLSPLFEECGVDITFAGHVHNYQRSLPLKFAPEPMREKKKGKVDGTFTLDSDFDGITKTVPSGIIHIVSGGGGASLYGPGLEKTAPYLKEKYGANYADFTAKMIVDQHSFVTLNIAPDRLHLRAVSASGEELDAVSITKKK